MRYPAAEKLEIIQLVEQSHLPVRGRWSRSESQDPRFIDGAIFIRLEGQRRWTIAALGLIGCGTASPMTSAPGSSHWPSTNLSSHPGTGRALYRCRALLRVGSLGVSPAQGPRPDHQSGLHRDESCRRVQGQDDGAEPALADRLHLSEGDWLGLVLFVDRARRLLPLHRCLEAQRPGPFQSLRTRATAREPRCSTVTQGKAVAPVSGARRRAELPPQPFLRFRNEGPLEIQGNAVNSGACIAWACLGADRSARPSLPRGIEPSPFQWPFKCGRATSIKSSMV